MKLKDEELVKQALAGESESFGKLVQKYQGAVHGVAYHLTGSFEDAEDIAQEAFVTAYLKLRQLRHPERFVAWIRQITRNCCRMWMRKRKESVSIDEVEELSLGVVPSPAEEVEREEMRRLVHRALSQITEKNRLVITLYYLDGLSYRDIAHFLDVPLSTVEGRMHRAKKQLKGQLTKMVENTLRNEKLSDEFTQGVLDEAIKRAKEAQEQWATEDFVRSCQEALEAAEKLEDARTQIELFSMLGKAETTWLGEPEKAIENYESALAVAQKAEDRAEEAKVLLAMSAAYCRRGEYDKMRQQAQGALQLSSELGDGENEAMARAALDLADALPNVWSPGQPGGYVMAVFPVEVSDEGFRFSAPKSVRNYTWGCPSRCAAFVHLLRPRRLLGQSLSVGATWLDRITYSPDGLSWKTPEDDELIATSEVESEDDVVLTPAGKFTGCLRVRTIVTPTGGGTATENATRSYCGIRLTWFAPGVGLVKFRHESQNENDIWNLYLTEYTGGGNGSYFPLVPGLMWKYRWMNTGYPPSLFEDICRVVAVDGSTAYLSSATYGVQRSEAEYVRYFEEMLELEQVSGDIAGEAVAIDQLAGRLGEDEQDKKLAYRERLVSIYEMLQDEWKLLNARWSLDFLSKGQTLEELRRCEEEKLELARQLGDWMREARALLSLAYGYSHSGDEERSIELREQVAAIFAEQGDTRNAAYYIAELEWIKEARQQPSTPQRSYKFGVNYITEKDGKLYCEGSSSSSTVEKFPPGDKKGSPMTKCPLGGIELLSEEVGHSCTDVSNTSTPWKATESMRTISTLVSKGERITVSAGEFSGCSLIETHISTSDEAKYEETERRFYQGYWAGTHRVWFAPGVGLVRLLYQHKNGCVTDIQLVEYETTELSKDYFPLSLNNRWHYKWVDQKSGTSFEDMLRVASHKKGRWNIAFVTRATAKE